VRTPICKARRGAFKDTPADDLLATVLRAALERSGVAAPLLGSIVVGNVLLPNSAFVARIAQFLAGIPETVPLHTVNRQCASGLEAVVAAADAVRAGRAAFAIGAGVESMSTRGMADGVADLNPRCVSGCETIASSIIVTVWHSVRFRKDHGQRPRARLPHAQCVSMMCLVWRVYLCVS
jgi:acetyl-CoA acetyltransferase